MLSSLLAALSLTITDVGTAKARSVPLERWMAAGAEKGLSEGLSRQLHEALTKERDWDLREGGWVTFYN